MNEEPKRVSDCCGAEMIHRYNSIPRGQTICTGCGKPCTARKSAELKSFNYDRTEDPDPEISKPMDSTLEGPFDLDGFFAGAKRAGEILHDKECAQNHEFDMQCSESWKKLLARTKCICFYSKPSEPKKKGWEEEFKKEFVAIGADVEGMKRVEYRQFRENQVEALKAFITRMVKEAEERAVAEHDAKWHPINDTFQMQNEHIRADERKRIVEEIRQLIPNMDTQGTKEVLSALIVRFSKPDGQ